MLVFVSLLNAFILGKYLVYLLRWIYGEHSKENVISLFMAPISLLLLLLLLFHSLWVFHSSVSWWSLTGILVTASFLKYPGLSSVFWPILIILSLDGLDSSFDFQFFQSFLSLWRRFQLYQLYSVSPSFSCSTVLLVFWQGPSTCLFICFFYFHSMVRWNDWVHYTASPLLFFVKYH